MTSESDAMIDAVFQRAGAIIMTRRNLTISLIPVLFSVLLFGAGLAGASDGAQLGADGEALDAWISARIPADGPGLAVIVVRDGEVILRKGYGLADIENNLQVKPEHVFRVGSITKQFTSAAIMLLQEDGKLSVTDPITKYLPDYPTHGYEITIHHLLTHTSGIQNYTDIPTWYGEYSKQSLTPDELIASFSDEESNFDPGSAFRYSNSGYALLGAIIEVVSGETYETFIETRIFEPLGLDGTYYGGDIKIIPNRAEGYEIGEDGTVVNDDFIDMSSPYSAGAIVSTVGDLATWFVALASGQVVSAESYAAMTAKTTLDDGETSGYGYGLTGQTIRGRAVVAHGGGINGFNSTGHYLPEQKIYVSLLRNLSGGSPSVGYLSESIIAMTLGDPYPARIAIQLDDAQKARHIGDYRAAEGFVISIFMEESQLYMDGPVGKLRALAESEDIYFFKDSFVRLEFESGEDGAVDIMNIFRSEEGGPAFRAEKIAETEEDTGR